MVRGSNSELYQATGFREHEYVSFQFKNAGRLFPGSCLYRIHGQCRWSGRPQGLRYFDTNDQAGTGLEYSETSKTYSGSVPDACNGR